MGVLGIDIGGSGIKAAPVDVVTGQLLGARKKITTPRPATPEAVTDVVRELAASFGWTGPIGATFPGVITSGVVRTAANVDKSWIGTDAAALFAKAAGTEVAVLNDADAAGVAEMTFGAGRGEHGTVLMLTFGTGIGSALFIAGQLVPNTEFGHIEIRGRDAEKRASEHAKETHDLSWSKWADRVDEYLLHMEALLSPDLIVVGGGISKESEKWVPLLDGIRARVVPATLHNDAGIVGAAMAAADLATPDAPALAHRMARGAQRLLHLANPQPAEVEDARGEHRVGPGVDGRGEVRERSGAAAGDHWDGDRGTHQADQLQVESGRGAVRVHRVQQDLTRAELGGVPGPADRVDAGSPAAAVRGHLEPAVRGRRTRRNPARVHGKHHALRTEPAGGRREQRRPGDRRGVQRHLVGAGPQQRVHVRARPHAAADGQRDEHLPGGAPHHVVGGLPAAA